MKTKLLLTSLLVALTGTVISQAQAMQRQPGGSGDDDPVRRQQDIHHAKTILRQERDKPAEFQTVRNMILEGFQPDGEPEDETSHALTAMAYQWLNESFLAAGVSLVLPNAGDIRNRLLSERDFPHEWADRPENLAAERDRILGMMDGLTAPKKITFAQTFTRLKRTWLDHLNAQLDDIR